MPLMSAAATPYRSSLISQMVLRHLRRRTEAFVTVRWRTGVLTDEVSILSPRGY